MWQIFGYGGVYVVDGGIKVHSFGWPRTHNTHPEMSAAGARNERQVVAFQLPGPGELLVSTGRAFASSPKAMGTVTLWVFGVWCVLQFRTLLSIFLPFLLLEKRRRALVAGSVHW